MTRGIELFFTLFNNLAIFLALVTFYNYLIREYYKSFWVKRQILAGFSFGVFAIVCMYAQIPVFEGVIVDQRNTIIVLSGAFGGPVSAIISAVLAGMFRLHLGGIGVLAGLVSVTLSAMAGTVLYRYEKNFESVKKAAVSSFWATLVILPGFLFVNDLQTGWGLLKAIGLPYGAASFCGIFLVGLMLKKQEQSLSIEQSFRKSQEQLALALTGANDGYWDWDLTTDTVYFSPRYKEILGYTDGEFPDSADFWRQTVYPEDLAPAKAALKKLINGEAEHVEYEFRMHHKDGSLRWILSRGTGVKNEDGIVSRLAGTQTDITERKRAENQLKQALLEQSAILENANVGIVQVKNRIIVKCNKKMAEIFGYELEEMVNQNTRRFYSSRKHYEKSVRRIDPIIFGGGVYTTERELSRKDGSPVWVQISGTAIDVNAPESGSIWVFEDISETKAREQELQEAKAEAEEASKLKSEFLANMSHEIRTPMNGVIGMADLLIDTPLSTEQWHYTNAIRSSGELLLGLINDILDLSKIEAGKLDMETIDFDLFSLLDDFLDSMAARAHKKNLELLCSVAQGTPPFLRGDPGRLRQVLNNLTGNAIKFTGAGEILIKVSVVKESEKDCLIRFVVSDTGIGIPGDKLALLFDKFSQVDASTTRRYGGTGLGLAIAKQLVEMMAGEIGVSSHEGSGSQFWFTARLEKRKVPESQLPPVPVDLHGVRILVVDDNATNREILTTQLMAWGMRPAQSPNAPRALVELERAVDGADPYKLAVIDMQMPDMNGETLGRIIKDDPRHKQTRIIMLTSLGRRGDARRFEEAGFDAYATKPIRHRDFLFILINVVSGGSPTAPHALVTRHSAREKKHRFKLDARALVVEDNTINRQVAVGSLMKLGLRADAVANGVQALKALKRIPYDLVFMDIQMPGMDGYQTTRRIRHPEAGVINNKIPIIAMTAHAMQGDREKCLSNGMNDYISKPIDKRTLLDVLKRWLPAFAVPSPVVQPKTSLTKEKFPGLAGIDVHEALNALDMDFKSYKTYLLDFREDAESALDALRNPAGGTIPADVSALAHKLAGAAGNLRAFQVKDAAVALKQAARQGDMPAALVNELKKALQTFIDSVKPLGETEPIDAPQNIDLHSASQYMDKIEALITSSDFVEADLLLGLEQALGESVDQIDLNRLQSRLQDFDYQGADEAIKIIRARLDNQNV